MRRRPCHTIHYLISLLAVLTSAAEWHVFNSHKYLHLTGTLLSWQDARASCQSLAAGGDLVTLESAEEEAFVVGAVMDGVVVDTWIGCRYITPANVWTWAGTGASCAKTNSATYTRWHPGEPSTPEGDPVEQAICGSFWDSVGDATGVSIWNDEGKRTTVQC